MSNEKKTRSARNIYFTDDQWRRVTEAADKANSSASNFVASIVLNVLDKKK